MDTTKKSEVKYTYTIIGTSLAGLGAAISLSSQKKNFCMITGRDKRQITYPNGQLITVNEHGGASNYWHGVIPHGVRVDATYEELFKKFYKKESLRKEKLLFIPKKPIRSREHLTSKTIIVNNVEKIESIKNSVNIKIVFENGSEIVTEKLIIAAGLRNTHKILLNSNLIEMTNATADDHVCGYVGLIEKKELFKKTGIAMEIKKTKDGYLTPALFDEENEILFTFRPAKFEMTKDNNQLRGGPIYGKSSKFKILSTLLYKFKIGRILEAIALKTGILFKAKKYSIHFQAAESKVHTYNISQSKWLIKKDLTKLMSKVKGSAEKHNLSISEKFDNQVVYYGNHLYNLSCERKKSELWRHIDIVDASTTKNIGGTHHSFLQLVKSYEQCFK